MQDLGGSVPQVSFDILRKHFLPELKDIDFNATKDFLVSEGYLVDNLISNKKEVRMKAFDHLERICKKAIECAEVSFKRKSTLRYVHADSSSPLSELMTRSLPDGYGVLLPTDPILSTSVLSEANLYKVEWNDIGFAARYINESDDEDEFIKVLWSMQRIMSNDARRRFTFGITVENTTTRVWFCCRQAVVVSEAFDFMTDSDNLLYYILSMCFANKTDLGWDPTVTLVSRIGSCWQYDFKVGENTYRTTKKLSTSSADTLRGRATRVYKANKLLSDNSLGPDVALRDSWCDSTRKSENQILRDILEDTNDEEKKYFLTIVEEEDVRIDGKVDDTEDLIMRGFHFTGSRSNFAQLMFPKQPNRMLPNWSMTSSDGTSNLARIVTEITFQFHRKIHRRTVFKEVGVPIYKLTSTTEIFTALSHVVTEIMYKKRYVHRDVSIGNILVFNGQGKLSDMEYAKVMDRDATHNVRAGTINFISIEAVAGMYLNLPAVTPAPGGFYEGGTISQLRQLPAFSHNPLHDLESVWWVAVWCLFYKIPIVGVDDEEEQKNRAKEVFPQTFGSSTRVHFFKTLETFRDLAVGMYFVDLADNVLDPFQADLNAKYKAAEANMRETGINISVFNHLHERFQYYLKNATGMKDLRLKNLDTRKKRPASLSVHADAEAPLSKKAKSRRT